MWRSIRGKRVPDLDAYNEDARYRARVLGFPEESFVVQPSDFPPDWNIWDEMAQEPSASEERVENLRPPRRSAP